MASATVFLRLVLLWVSLPRDAAPPPVKGLASQSTAVQGAELRPKSSSTSRGMASLDFKACCLCYARKQWNQEKKKKMWRGCSRVVKSLFFLTGCGGKWASCLRWGVICWMETFVSLRPLVPPLRAGLFSVITLPPRPSPFLALCSCLASILTLLRWVPGSARGRGHGCVAADGLGKEEHSFWHKEPGCSFSPHPSSPGWSWATLHSLSCLFFPALCSGSPTTFHELQKCKNPSDFWSESLLSWRVK